MAYIIVGSSSEILTNEFSDELKTLLRGRCCLVYSQQNQLTEHNKSGCWVDPLTVADKHSSAIICDGDELHEALNSLCSLDQKPEQLTLIWYFHSSHREDEELQGAVLRASLCHQSRVVAVISDSDCVESLLQSWICDYTSPVVVPDIQSITVPVWRGHLVVPVRQNGEDEVYIPTEIYNMDSADHQPLSSHNSLVADLVGGCIQMVCEVDTSSIHCCMLGIMYRLQLLTSTHNIHLHVAENKGYIVRVVQPLSPPQLVSADTEHLLTSSKISTTEDWMSYILKGQLPKAAQVPAGPVYYKYYLMHPQSSHTDSSNTESGVECGNYLLFEFDTTNLTECLIYVNELTASSNHKWDFKEDTFSIYNTLRSHPFSPSDLIAEGRRYRELLSSSTTKDKMYKHLDKPDEWQERVTLSEFWKRKDAVRKHDNNLQRNTKDSTDQSAGCLLTLDTVRSHFAEDGKAKDSRFHLLRGNQEKSGLREYTWPQARLHYGPGICYSDDVQASSLLDPRLILYRDKHNSNETNSLYTTEVMPSVNIGTQLNQSAVSRSALNQSAVSRSALNQSAVTRRDRQNTSLTQHIRQSPRRGVRTHAGIKSVSLCKLTPPSVIKVTKTATSSTTDLTVTKCRQQAGEEGAKDASNTPTSTPGGQATNSESNNISRQLKADRNKKNEQRMRSAVQKALSINGIKRNHKLYEVYSKELYLLSMRGVKKLKSSVDLEKRMREIATAYAPAAVLTINMKSSCDD